MGVVQVKEDNKIVILNKENLNKTLAYKRKRIRRLFEMNEIIIAKDIDTDETLGVESMYVTPD
ncbi:hypothetical protein PDN41_23655 [Bacillus cereus]|nr:hypothetical protein [Bacillus cereus]